MAAAVVIVAFGANIVEEPVFVVGVPAAVVPVVVIPAGIPPTVAIVTAVIVAELVPILLVIVPIYHAVLMVAPFPVVTGDLLGTEGLVMSAADALQPRIAGVFRAAII